MDNEQKIFFYTVCFCISFEPRFVCGCGRGADPEITLMDYDGNEIALDSNVPYSPKNTCGECHDYDAITNAYHFQLGRTDVDGNIIVADDLDPRNPWLLSRGMYGKW